MSVVRFTIVDPAVAEEDGWRSKQNPSPYVALTPEGLSDSLMYLQDADELVIPDRSEIRVWFDYPLEKAHLLTLEAPDDKGFTRTALCECIARKYQEIYEEEEKTSALPVETVDAREGNGCINRAETDGVWGIWGHVLEDLLLTEVYQEQHSGKWRMCIDS